MFICWETKQHRGKHYSRDRFQKWQRWKTKVTPTTWWGKCENQFVWVIGHFGVKRNVTIRKNVNLHQDTNVLRDGVHCDNKNIFGSISYRENIKLWLQFQKNIILQNENSQWRHPQLIQPQISPNHETNSACRFWQIISPFQIFMLYTEDCNLDINIIPM